MSRAVVTSTSTRDAAPTGVRKKRRRIDPDTSTVSPGRQDVTDRRTRAPQAAHSSASTF